MRCYANYGQVSSQVNGPLLEILADSCGFHDRACIELFRKGGDIIGPLACSGNGTPIDVNFSYDVSKLIEQRPVRNEKLIEKVRVDEFAGELLAQTIADAKLGRMSEPVSVDDVDLCGISVCQRFGVLQGACFS